MREVIEQDIQNFRDVIEASLQQRLQYFKNSFTEDVHYLLDVFYENKPYDTEKIKETTNRIKRYLLEFPQRSVEMFDNQVMRLVMMLDSGITKGVNNVNDLIPTTEAAKIAGLSHSGLLKVVYDVRDGLKDNGIPGIKFKRLTLVYRSGLYEWMQKRKRRKREKINAAKFTSR